MNHYFPSMNNNISYNNNGANNHPHTLPPPPPNNNNGDFNWNGNPSYTTQQPFLASYRRSGDVAGRHIVVPQKFLDRGSIEQELNKERIRAGIIMEEIIQRRRRRDLEAQARSGPFDISGGW